MAEQKQKFFYGWYIVGGLGTIGMVSVGLGGICVGLFLTPMHRELNISHTFFGLGQTARLIGFAATSLWLGRILDRYGARIPMAVAGLLISICIFGLSQIQMGWHFVALFFVIGSIGMEGAGGNLYQSVPLSRWFIRKRGQAMAWSFVGATIGIFVFSPTIERLIATVGWRNSWKILGVGFGVIIVIIALSIIRKDPESMGLLPDGETSDEHNDSSQGGKVKSTDRYFEYSWTREQAVRHAAFWVLAIVFGLRMFSLSTITIFRVPFYIEQKLPPHLVAWAIAFEAVISALTAVPMGWAADRFQPRIITISSLLIFIVTFFVTLQVTSAWHLFFATGLFGICAASFSVAQNTLWPSYFGAWHIGSIRGFAMPLTTGFSALGGPLAGILKDATGDFKLAWWIAIAGLVVSVALLAFTPKPKIATS